MWSKTPRTCAVCIVVLILVCALWSGRTIAQQQPTEDRQEADRVQKDVSLNIHYLEIVTPDVADTCTALERTHGVKFSEPIAELGSARTATLNCGGRIGVRAPMRDTEEPVVRPYLLVDDIEDAIEAATAAGGQIAMPATEIPGQGRFAIYFLGGIQHGLWER